MFISIHHNSTLQNLVNHKVLDTKNWWGKFRHAQKK